MCREYQTYVPGISNLCSWMYKSMYLDLQTYVPGLKLVYIDFQTGVCINENPLLLK